MVHTLLDCSTWKEVCPNAEIELFKASKGPSHVTSGRGSLSDKASSWRGNSPLLLQTGSPTQSLWFVGIKWIASYIYDSGEATEDSNLGLKTDHGCLCPGIFLSSRRSRGGGWGRKRKEYLFLTLSFRAKIKTQCLYNNGSFFLFIGINQQQGNRSYSPQRRGIGRKGKWGIDQCNSLASKVGPPGFPCYLISSWYTRGYDLKQTRHLDCAPPQSCSPQPDMHVLLLPCDGRHCPSFWWTPESVQDATHSCRGLEILVSSDITHSLSFLSKVFYYQMLVFPLKLATHMLLV